MSDFTGLWFLMSAIIGLVPTVIIQIVLLFLRWYAVIPNNWILVFLPIIIYIMVIIAVVLYQGLIRLGSA